jgi:tRNA 2-thiouridine synthesizing protein A
MADHVLDAKGLLCPLPVLRARKALKPLPVGGILQVETTDAASPADFMAFCTATGNLLVASEACGGVYRFTIRKVRADPPPEG